MSGVGPKDGFERGGVLHAIVGSLIELGIALAITLPLGIGTAVFMTEVGGRFARVVRTVVEAMTALPSIVAGLFIYTVFIIALGYPRSGLAASLAIGVMILPIIARAADVVLRVVPGGLREASLALGASRWRTVWHVVLPTAKPGLATAVILGTARGVGETSPVLLTSGAAAFMVTNPTGGVMNSLPLFIYSNVRSGEPVAIERAFAAATALLAIVLILFIIARLLARPRRSKGPSLRVVRSGAGSGGGVGRQRAQAAEVSTGSTMRWPGPCPSPNLHPGVVVNRARPCSPCCSARGCLLALPGVAAADRVVPPASERTTYAQIEGTGSTWSELIVQQWIADVDANGMKVVYTGGGSSKGRKDFSQNSTDFAISEIPYQGVDEQGNADTSNGRPVRLPADRGRRHGVHLPAQDRWPAGPQPAAVGRDDLQDLHQPDHQLERPGDHRGQQRPGLPVAADHAGRPLGRLGHHRAVHALDGQPVPRRLAAVLRRLRAHVVLPAQGPRDRSGRLGPGDEHDRRLRGQRDHRVRRVLLPAEQGLPGRQGPQQGGLLRRADAVQHRGRADQGADQPGPEQPAVPDPDPRPGLREQGPAGLPDLVVQLHGHPDRGDRRPDDHGQAADAGRLPLLLAVRRPDQGGTLRLLATAAQPGAGRLRADRQAQGGRPAGRPDRPRRALVQQPHLRRQEPLEEQARRDRAAARRVRQGRRRTLRHRHRHQRAVDRRPERADRHRVGAGG